MGNQTGEERAAKVPDEPDLDPEQTVDELERKTVLELPDKIREVREADAKEAGDNPAIDQDLEPGEHYPLEPPS